MGFDCDYHNVYLKNLPPFVVLYSSEEHHQLFGYVLNCNKATSSDFATKNNLIHNIEAEAVVLGELF